MVVVMSEGVRCVRSVSCVVVVRGEEISSCVRRVRCDCVPPVRAVRSGSVSLVSAVRSGSVSLVSAVRTGRCDYVPLVSFEGRCDCVPQVSGVRSERCDCVPQVSAGVTWRLEWEGQEQVPQTCSLSLSPRIQPSPRGWSYLRAESRPPSLSRPAYWGSEREVGLVW